MLAPYLIYPILKLKYNLDFETSLIIIVAWSTVVWLTVTFLTKPSEEEKLISFYKKVHPGGIGWRRIVSKTPETISDSGFGRLFLNWFCGCIMVLCALFGTGKIIFHEYTAGIIFIFTALLAGGVIYYNLSKIGWKKII